MKKQETGKTVAGKKNIFLFLSILAIVAVSGCISVGDLFGSGTTTVEASSDVMSFSDSTVIPNPPILTGDTFTTDFTIKNLDEFEDAKNVKLDLYDWGVCIPSSCSSPSGWDAIDSTKLQTSYSASLNGISPNDVQQVECQFRSPSSEKIGGLDAKCPVRYKLTYDFSGITTTDLNVISNKKFQEMSRAGQTSVVTSVQSKSRGPIKVDFSFGVNQPVRTSSADSEVKIPMYVRIENKGTGTATKEPDSIFNKEEGKKCKTSGNLEPISGQCFGNGKNTFFCNNGNIELCGSNRDTNIKIDSSLCIDNSGCKKSKNFELNIKIPKDIVEGKDCTKIECDKSFVGVEDDTKNNCILTLKADKSIDFVKDKSEVFRCELTSPADSVVPEQKTYSIQSEVKYTYQIDNDFSVAIKPMTFG